MGMLVVGVVAAVLVVVAFQISCLFAYEESKKEKPAAIPSGMGASCAE